MHNKAVYVKSFLPFTCYFRDKEEKELVCIIKHLKMSIVVILGANSFSLSTVHESLIEWTGKQHLGKIQPNLLSDESSVTSN